MLTVNKHYMGQGAGTEMGKIFHVHPLIVFYFGFYSEVPAAHATNEEPKEDHDNNESGFNEEDDTPVKIETPPTTTTTR